MIGKENLTFMCIEAKEFIYHYLLRNEVTSDRYNER